MPGVIIHELFPLLTLSYQYCLIPVLPSLSSIAPHSLHIARSTIQIMHYCLCSLSDLEEVMHSQCFLSLTASACAQRTAFLICRSLSAPRLARRLSSVSEKTAPAAGAEADMSKVCEDFQVSVDDTRYSEGVITATRSGRASKTAQWSLTSTS